jgi:acetyl-CoA carboxylase carboxyltransferase component
MPIRCKGLLAVHVTNQLDGLKPLLYPNEGRHHQVCQLFPVGLASRLDTQPMSKEPTVVEWSQSYRVTARRGRGDDARAYVESRPRVTEDRVQQLRSAREQASDAARPDVVERRHAAGFLMARERIQRLLDPGSGIEVGLLAGYSPQDGWRLTRGGVDSIGTVHGLPVITSSTDFTDHGGGYGAGRIPRLMALAAEHRWPAVLFVDGGGSKPPDTDAAPDTISVNGTLGPFHYFDGLAELSGLVPTVAIVSGPSFAGHASLAGGASITIATRGSSIGMAGPPLVRPALGLRLTPSELAGVEMHDVTGGIDLLVDDEEQAIAAARKLLGFLAGAPSAEPLTGCPDDLVAAVADGAYDMRDVINGLVDSGSQLELRRNWATTVITALARIGGRPAGILASQVAGELRGAIDADAADKVSRFVELCDFLRFPLVSLVDTPGCVIRRGDRVRPGFTRHHARPLFAHHHRTVPLVSVQLGQGADLALGALTGIGSGHSTVPALRLAWPSVTLTPPADLALPLSNALDDVILPSETRQRLTAILRLISPVRQPAFGRPADPYRAGSVHRPVDTW